MEVGGKRGVGGSHRSSTCGVHGCTAEGRGIMLAPQLISISPCMQTRIKISKLAAMKQWHMFVHLFQGCALIAYSQKTSMVSEHAWIQHTSTHPHLCVSH